MENFTPLSGAIGGALIGAAAALLLWCNGRLAGVSGIASGLLRPLPGDWAWRALFLIGLVIGAGIYRLGGGPLTAIEIDPSVTALIAGGLLVGVGTHVGGGCTSGHGVCGLARISPRSLVATLTFLVAGGVTVYIARHLAGG